MDATMRFVKTFGADITEETLGDAALALNLAGKRSDGLVFMRYRCDLYPASWGARLLLADRLLEDDDRTAALAAYRAAQDLITRGAPPAPSRWSRLRIAAGIKKAEAK
jgi:hypothetical protein